MNHALLCWFFLNLSHRYNDWEWAVADFAIVRAGLVPVGVHGTYQHEEAVGVLCKAEAKALCCMSDIFAASSRGELWSVRKAVEALAPANSLRLVVGMDISLTQVREYLRGVDVDTASFLNWVAPPQKVRTR